MKTITSSLLKDLSALLSEKSKASSAPKNKLIEKPIRLYLEQLNKVEYLKSYRKMSDNADVLKIAKEGLTDCFKRLDGESR